MHIAATTQWRRSRRSAARAGTLGIWQAGGIAVPLATSHPPPELDYVLQDAGLSAVSGSRWLSTLRPHCCCFWRKAERGRQQCSPGCPRTVGHALWAHHAQVLSPQDAGVLSKLGAVTAPRGVPLLELDPPQASTTAAVSSSGANGARRLSPSARARRGEGAAASAMVWNGERCGAPGIARFSGGVAGTSNVAAAAGWGPGAEQGALIIYTSGTTGRPKGALHTHRCVAFGGVGGSRRRRLCSQRTKRQTAPAGRAAHEAALKHSVAV